MGRTNSVAYDPSDRVRRGHLPALRAGRNLTTRCIPVSSEAEKAWHAYFQETPVRSVAGVGEFSHMPTSSFFQTPILASW